MDRYKTTQKSIPEIARELNVDAIIESSVLKIGNTARITVQLIDGKTDHHIWAQQYDRHLENILVLMSEVTRDISQQVEIVLSPREQDLLKAEVVNPQAHALLMRGQYKIKGFTAVGLEEALTYVSQAIEIDSNYAQAWAQKGMINVLMALFGLKPSNQLLPEAHAAINTAIKINSNLSECYTALGFYHLLKWHWKEAGENFRKALDLNQNDATALHGLGDYLTLAGKPEEGMILVERSGDLNPFSPAFSIPVINHLAAMHRYDEALSKVNIFQDLHPDYDINLLVARIHWCQKKYEKSIDTYRVWLSGNNFNGLLNALESGYLESGPSGALRSVAELWEQESKSGKFRNPSVIASFFGQIQDKEKTLEWLGKAYEQHVPGLYHIFLSPEYGFVRSDPGFIELLKKMNLPAKI
jgi:tetratricopeptide (TPR) repeat protein